MTRLEADRRRFLQQAAVLVGGALLAACGPQKIKRIFYEPFPRSTFTIEPYSGFSTVNFDFGNWMNGYNVDLNFDALQKTIDHYKIETKFKVGNKIGMDLVEDDFLGPLRDGVNIQPELLGWQLIEISGGQILKVEQNKFGEPLGSQAAEKIMSCLLSTRMVSGLLQLAQQRGDMANLDVLQVEKNYFDAALLGEQPLIAQMNGRYAPPSGLI